MNPSSRCPKIPAKLADSTHQRLNMYTLAAGAAGVGMLALVQPAEAKIVYTPTHRVTSPHHPLFIDLNHDGINDFQLATYYAGGSGFSVGVRAEPYNVNSQANKIVGKGYYALALRAGANIGPKRQFGESRMATEAFNSQRGTTQFRGLWQNNGKGVTNRYLGLKFVVKGKIHFGWARVSVTLGHQSHVGDVVGTLTGYAYETIPNKPIIAGKTKGPGKIDSAVGQPNPAFLATPTPQPATLGVLALGSPGLAIWQREESVGSLP